jgi:hypothetical protein
MTLTAAEQIKVRQILKVPSDRMSDLMSILVQLTDTDVLAAVRDSLLQWDGLRAARNPDRAGMIKADVVEWDSSDRCKALCHLEAQIKLDLALTIGWDSSEVLAF